MAVQMAAVTVATTATALTAGESSDLNVLIHNAGGATVYIGSASVTTAAGMPVAAGEKVAVNGLAAGEALYGIVAASTEAVRVLRTAVG